MRSPLRGYGVARATHTLLLFLALSASGTAQAAAQAVEVPAPGETVYEVRLTDGSSVYARITAVDADRVTFETVGGIEMRVSRVQISAISVAEGRVVRGEYWPVDPNGTRLFFTSTGRALPKGQGYVGTYLIVLPFVAVGVTDAFTLAAGAPVLFGEFEPFYLAPKLRVVKAEKVELSLGTIAFFFKDENIGIAYGVGTFGTPDQALTLGLGFGYEGADFNGQPVAMIGGEVRAGRKVKLITENYFLPGEEGVLLSGGLRIIGERFSTDVGVFGFISGEDAGCCVPTVNFSYSFGGKR